MATKNGILSPVLVVLLAGFGLACSSSDGNPTGGAAAPVSASPGMNTCPNAPATCGNGLIEAGEQCDQGNTAMGVAANFNNMDCTMLTGGGGSLTCTCCQIMTDMCMAAPVAPAAGFAADQATPVGGQGG